MLERLKGARPDKTEAQTEAEDRKRDEAKDGMPRFEPQPGGFGRRATPVTGNTAANSDSPGGSKPAARTAEIEAPQPQFRRQDPHPAASNDASGPISAPTGASAGGGWSMSVQSTPGQQALGDIPTRVADWLMPELKDQRGIHCETLL